MRRLAALLVLGLFAGLPFSVASQRASAQPPTEEDPEGDEEPIGDEEGTGEEGTGEEGTGEQGLRPPTIEPLEIPPDEEEPIEEEPTEPPPEEEPEPEPEPEIDAQAALDSSAPPSATPAASPAAVLTLHGYFRVRGELQDTFWLGREALPGEMDDRPFSDFRPIDNGTLPPGGCDDDREAMGSTRCDGEVLSFANMRLRLEPTLSLSDDVRVHLMLDVFDNVVLGSTADSSAYTTPDFARAPRTPYSLGDWSAMTNHPPIPYRNSLSDSIVARRAWAEVTNRGLGMLRFGRMGSHWGLGLVQNDGRGIDGDYSNDVDRVMGVTKLAGLYLVAAYDFADEGYIQQFPTDLARPAFDAGQRDDVDQFVFSVARQLDDQEQRDALARDELVLNGGLYFIYRTQNLSTSSAADPFAPPGTAALSLLRRGAETFIPDLWGQLLYRSLRVEVEAALYAGGVENSRSDDAFEDLGILSFGGALESEYRLLDDKLSIRFGAGYGTGDDNVEGLAAVNERATEQNDGDNTISTFRFHPNYRVDLILWRTILRQVSGAYYFRPGISYDFIRDDFGQLFGASADFIWSRASSTVQTWGNDPDLGVEINASIYYRSQDGPELLDGFFASVQYGVLFPMKGLGYLQEGDRGQFPGRANPDLENAQTLRVILGVQY